MDGSEKSGESSGKIDPLNYDKQHGKKAGSDPSSTAPLLDPEHPGALSRNPTATDLITRAADFAVSAEYTLGQLTQERPLSYAVKSSPARIDSEEKALIAWAKESHRFFNSVEIAKFEQASGEINVGGTEHDVWKIEGDGGPVIIRRTIKDSFGFAHRSPYQYLLRMAEVSAAVTAAPIDIIGLSHNSRGNAVIWTVQPYVEGVHPSRGELIVWLQREGWQEVSTDHGYLVFEKQGVKMHDIHPANFIKTASGDIIPIDVFFEGL